ncbi:hypothetical protein SFRURICE_007035 [Spodoptera frugiperda]|nr:hypothetical protein SFRURICE_007035 [Spodoptera frugiperda]
MWVLSYCLDVLQRAHNYFLTPRDLGSYLVQTKEDLRYPPKKSCSEEFTFMFSYYRYLFTTRLSPNKAKYFFPCFENPRFEAVYKFKVYIVKQLPELQYTNTSLVIAEEQRRDGIKGDYIVVDYIPSPQVGLHQVGFHYSLFASSRVQGRIVNDTLIIWAPKDELRDYQFIHNYGITIINLIHEYSKENRPLVQGPINLIAVPADINGYEIGSWNLLTNGEHRLAKIDQFTSIKQIEYMTFELAQQLCRIWLGNPGEVERTRWKEEWFKEGMATYLAYYFLTQYNHGIMTQERRRLAAYGLQMKHKAMAVDWHRSTPALETFNTSLAIEIPPRRGKYISLQDFTTTLDQNTIECLHQFFNGSTASRILGSWFRRRGYPVINVQVLRDRSPNAVQLKQRQFSFNRENREVTDFLIPISYVVENNQNCYNCYRPRFTIGAQSYTFGEVLNDGWIILNRQGSGYYRVNYDPVTWRLIAKTLKENMMSIDELNRAQIVNDVFALYVAGDLDIDLAMEILDYLEKERSPSFMVKKIVPIYTQLVKSKDNQYLMRLFKSSVVELACSLNYEPCHYHVKELYIEDTRHKHNLFPDCRMSYFFKVANDTSMKTFLRKLNQIELDDKNTADKKVRERNRFFAKTRIGEPRPMPIAMSTTTEKFVETVTEKLQTGGSSCVKYSFYVIFIAMFVNILTR